LLIINIWLGQQNSISLGQNLEAHNKLIENGKWGFLFHPKPVFSLEFGLDSNDLHEEYSNFFVIITPCAFLW
jgi:hypothetical protein